MVTLSEVPDEHFVRKPLLEKEDEDEDFTDTESQLSVESDFDPRAETLAERLAQLRMVVPPGARQWLGTRAGRAARAGSSAVRWGLRAAWVVSVSVLVFGIPYALCVREEQQLLALEEEMRMREAGGEMLTAGADADAKPAAQPAAQPAL